jgi:hypothetical protein
MIDESIKSEIKMHLEALRKIFEKIDEDAQKNDELAWQLKSIYARRNLEEIDNIMFNLTPVEKD